ncbi:MAG: biotin transporter BioY [Anaerovoracaceae bacterium]|jgi:biotin transport system substrate-specific component
MNKTSKTNKLILCAFFAALTAVCTMITIPLPFSPVPINLAILSVLLAGSLLGAKAGTLSQFVYVCLGAIGLPIFSNFSGGPSVLVGPTGGYIVGYIVTAFIVGTFSDKSAQKKLSMIWGFLIGLIACYIMGTLWFMFIMKTNLWPTLMMCVIPFIPGDGFKILLAFLLTKKLKSLSLFLQYF